MYTKRLNEGDTNEGDTMYLTQAFVEKGWVVIHQSEVIRSGRYRLTSTSSVVKIPMADFLKMVETLKEDTQ